MPSFRTRRTVPFSPQQMFALVGDIERYPEFLPLCEDLVVRSRTVDDNARVILTANMTCGYKAIRESFISRVTLDQDRARIVVEYIDGPFRHLENTWAFHDAGGRCDVDFAISYEFKSRMLGVLVGGLFDRAFRKFADAFEQRAGQVYGRRAQGGADDDLVALSDPLAP